MIAIFRLFNFIFPKLKPPLATIAPMLGIDPKLFIRASLGSVVPEVAIGNSSDQECLWENQALGLKCWRFRFSCSMDHENFPAVLSQIRGSLSRLLFRPNAYAIAGSRQKTS